ncbi:transcriptional regulator, SarA/Rot family [Latilactobacillus sp. 5-91]|uniref:transcriptional regulator, SarA/Rot family n=1 Tax=Latilactobacillus sp. 5-91 TaxID=3410924 RepID=UPI003C741ED3
MKNKKQQVLALGQWYFETSTILKQLNSLCRTRCMTFEQFLFLEQLVQDGTQSPSGLAIKFNTSGPIVTRKLNTLKDKGLIKKTRGNRLDQRVVSVTITEQGQNIYDQLAAELANWYQEQQTNQTETFK